MFHEDWFPEPCQTVLAKLVGIVKDVPGHLIEIGAWEGRSTVAMANAGYPRTVHTCDTWEGSGHEISAQLATERDVYAEWQTNVRELTQGNVVGYRCGWRDFVPTIDGPIALAFIDAEHTRQEVADNVRALIPLMAPGGIICGDDAHHPPVQEGVFDVVPEDDVYVLAALWIWQMPSKPEGADPIRLQCLRPELAPTVDEWETALTAVKAPWVDYVTNVSTPTMAVSFETAAYLHHICGKLKPARILDMGSGFSTYVLSENASVISIDTDAEWLMKTSAFLSDNKREAGLLTLTDAVQRLPQFDLVFHDIAGGQIREDTMQLSCDLCKPGGVIVFDDMHHQSHQQRMMEVTEGWERYTLHRWTNDPVGRYAILAIKPDAPATPAASLEAMYYERCATPSDIYQHLPRMVALVQALNAQHVIELGSRSGVSTVAWLYALEQTGGRLTSVDLDQAPEIGTYGHWRHIRGNDLDPGLLVGLAPADIVFIDTSHALQQTRDELAAYLPLVRKGGVICGHDSELARPEDSPESDGPFPVKRAVAEFVKAHGFQAINYPDNNGFFLIRVV